ncbi:MAG TPA: hypothetical protein VFU15_14860 [Bacteroidia bacterium]|nr:hypothetical protein [Bacteroidia bacterium]
MKKVTPLIILLATVLFVACRTQSAATGETNTTQHANTGDQDGLSFQTAVVVLDTTETKGIATEYVWMGIHYPGWHVQVQSLVFQDKKPYDVFVVKKGRKKKKLYFDISNFFGKW